MTISPIHAARECASCGANTEFDEVTCSGCGEPLRRSAIRSPGTILGSYRLLEVLGKGGMGVVYLAEHTRLGRKVALKTLRSEFSSNPQAVRRFFGEARAVNKIHHQNIVEITDFVEQPGGDNYYIMELLRGTTLANVIDREGIQPLERSVGIMAQVARALQAVHDAGIVHRDLKPDNVFVIERGGQKDFVKLLDFGVAKLADAGEGIAVNSTAAGTILGTPEYMSPEQASGKKVDHRTDIYSFGIVLYELITGVLPLRGTSFGELVVKHLTVDPIPPSKVKDLPHVVPPELEDATLACLAKDEADRPQRIDVLAERLEAIADARGWELASFTSSRVTGRMSLAEPLQKERKDSGEKSIATAPTVMQTRSPRRRVAIAIAGVVAIAALALVIWQVTRGDGEAQVAEPAVVSTPPPVPAAPREIEIDITTTPPGADVVRLSDGVTVATTPTVLRVAAADTTERYELRLAGHRSEIAAVKLDRPTRITNVLQPFAVASEPVPPPPPATKPTRKPPKPAKPAVAKPDPRAPKPPKPPTPPPDRTGVMNPFDQ